MDIRKLFVFGRLLGISLGCILLYFVVKYAFILLYPFGIALILSFMLNPFVTFLESKWNTPRILATSLCMIIMLIAIFGTLFLFVTELIHGTIFLAEKVPDHFEAFMYVVNQILHERILPYYDKITSFFKTLHPSQQSIISQNIESLLTQVGSTGAHFLQKIFLSIRMFLSVLPQSLTVVVFILLSTFLMTKDFPKIRKHLRKKIPLTTRKSSIDIFIQLRTLLFGYVKAQFIIITITAIIILIGLLIIQIDHALTIAFLMAIIDLLPFVGTGTVFIPWIFYLFFTGNYPLTIQLAVLYMIVVIVRQLIEPKIMSDQLGVQPLITLMVMFASYQVWGFIGIIIAPFLIVFFNALKRAGVIEQVIHYVKG